MNERNHKSKSESLSSYLEALFSEKNFENMLTINRTLRAEQKLLETCEQIHDSLKRIKEKGGEIDQEELNWLKEYCGQVLDWSDL